jgi:plasmid stabilization system protein ParE
LKALAVEYTGAARLDVLESKQWYEAKEVGLGLRFAIRINEAVERISHQPLGAPEIHRGVRRVVTKQFRHLVFYRVEADRVVILGVRHERENPTSWPES